MAGAGRRPIGLEHLSLREETVSTFVAAAAAGGADSVCLSVNHPGTNDPGSLRAVLAQVADEGMSVAMGDGFPMAVDGDLDAQKRRLDLVVAMGAPYANVCALKDVGAASQPHLIHEALGTFCQLAATAGVSVLIEFTPLSHVPGLVSAAELVADLGQPNLRILLDTLHLARAGEGPEDVARVDPALFGYCQVSDAVLVSDGLEAYFEEAVHDRRLPGDGELPLERVLAHLPRDVVISAEVPLRRLAGAGVSPAERARLVLEATRRLVDRVTDGAGAGGR